MPDTSALSTVAGAQRFRLAAVTGLQGRARRARRLHAWKTSLLTRAVLSTGLLLTTVPRQAGASSSGTAFQRLQTAHSLILKVKGKVVFDASRTARKILSASTCSLLTYTLRPLSKVGALLSYLEETALSGPDCGASGASYDLSIQVVNLDSGQPVTLSGVLPQAKILGFLQHDPYLQAVARQNQLQLQAPTLDAVLKDFSEHYNGQNCDAALNAFSLTQFFVQRATPSVLNFRLGLTYQCGAPSDVRMPKLLGFEVPRGHAGLLRARAGEFTFSEVMKLPPVVLTLKRGDHS